MFREVGAIKKGHFVLASGRHAKTRIEKVLLYPYTKKVDQLCWEIAEYFSRDYPCIVIAPATGGIILSHCVADHMSRMASRTVLSLYAEKTKGENGFTINPGYREFIKGKDVLVLEDILTTGGSVKKVIRQVRRWGGKVIGVGALWNRGGITAKDLGDVPKLFSLVNVTLETFTRGKCQKCKANRSKV